MTRYWTRLCAPLSICGSVTSSLENFLAETVNLLLAYRRSNSAKWRDTEKLGFKNLCLVFKSVLLPYIQQCLSALFPPNYLSEVCGFSSSDLQSRKLGFIIQAKICLPILDFMPEEPGKLLKWFSWLLNKCCFFDKQCCFNFWIWGRPKPFIIFPYLKDPLFVVIF